MHSQNQIPREGRLTLTLGEFSILCTSLSFQDLSQWRQKLSPIHLACWMAVWAWTSSAPSVLRWASCSSSQTSVSHQDTSTLATTLTRRTWVWEQAWLFLVCYSSSASWSSALQVCPPTLAAKWPVVTTTIQVWSFQMSMQQTQWSSQNHQTQYQVIPK